MFADHVWFGPSGRKSRPTRSEATLTPGSRTVVRRRLHGRSPEIPAAFISRCTRLRPTRIPCSSSNDNKHRYLRTSPPSPHTDPPCGPNPGF
jgi:hypothetical protein